MLALASTACDDVAEPGAPPLPVEVTPETPRFDDATCLPTDAPSRSPLHRLQDTPFSPPTGSPRLGAAVGAAQFGPSSDPATHLDLLVGAPDAVGAGGRTGLVRWVAADRSTGALAHASAHAEHQVAAPAASVHAFGHALLAASWRDAYTAGSMRGASGHEVLVGAPDSDGDRGAVFLYETRIATSDLSNAHDRSKWSWASIGNLPHSPSAGDRFGFSLAADRRGEPDQRVPWVAVGAPGANAVYIFRLPSFGTEPLALELVQTLTPATLGAGFTAHDFGWSLVADDFDRDGFLDLAIGAPGDTQIPGKVFVVPGAHSGSAPLDGSIPTEIVGSLGTTARFGHAIDGGNLFRQQQGGDPSGPRALAIGAPAASSGRGGVCWVAFEQDRPVSNPIAPWNPSLGGSAPSCASSPLPTANAAFGWAVAIGNVAPLDPFLNDDSPEALAHELVVGAPGARAFDWDPIGSPPSGWSPLHGSDPASGLVVVLRSDLSSGPLVPSTVSADRDDRPLAERILRPDTTSFASSFGTSLHILDVERTARPDLLVGSPDRDGGKGAFQLLNSSGVNAATSGHSGDFTGLDSNDSDHEMRVVDNTTRIIVRSNESFPFFSARMIQPDPEDPEQTVGCEAGGNPMSFLIPARFTFPHALGGGSTTTLLGLEAEEGAFIDPTEVDATWENDSAYRLTVVVTDTGFDDSDPANDTIMLDVTTLEVWRCNDWRDVQQPMQIVCGLAEPTVTPVDPACYWQNGPFTFTRTASLGETCE